MTAVYSRRGALPKGFKAASLPPMPLPSAALMCPPDHYDVVDVKNPFMAGHVGQVHRELARAQWEALVTAFERRGVGVERIAPEPGREDMVFCANQTLPALDPRGRRVCLLAHMKHPSRREEVPAFARWFEEHGWQVEAVGSPAQLFEGCGDAVWHPGRRLLWGGWGQRTEAGIYPAIAKRLELPVLTLELATSRFYHLDTCFCPVDEKTVLVHPPSLAEEGMELVRAVFEDVIEVDQREAMDLMACNAAAFFGKVVFLQRGAKKTNAALQKRGFEVVEVETGEFMKSGGSVFCLKMALF